MKRFVAQNISRHKFIFTQTNRLNIQLQQNKRVRSFNTARQYGLKQFMRDTDEPIGEDAGLGLLLLAIASGLYLGLEKLYWRIRSELESSEWPIATGQIEYICYRKSKEHPTVTYQYKVMGKLYTCHRLRPRVITNVPLFEKAPEYMLVARPHDFVPVYYNPKNPADAVLIPSKSIAIPDIILTMITGAVFGFTGYFGARRMGRFVYRYSKSKFNPSKPVKVPKTKL